MRRIVRVLAAAWVCLGAAIASADEVLFLNGDRLTGAIVRAGAGRLTIRTEVAGEVTVDLATVRTFSTDRPVVLRIGDATFTSAVTAGPDGAIQAIPEPGAAPRLIAFGEIAQINPPRPRWKGSIAATGLFTTGNSETSSIGLRLDAARRAERSRITVGAGARYGRQLDPDTGEHETTTDSAFGFGKYDYFFSERQYILASLRIERDRLADLDLRLTPSLGGGYQWLEGPRLELATEAGVAWVYEDYRRGGRDDRVAVRLAYRLDYRPRETILLFHHLEWLPGFEHPFVDYDLHGDAGLRATILGNLFSEVKVELRYDSMPAPGAENTDLRYLLSLGWTF